MQLLQTEIDTRIQGWVQLSGRVEDQEVQVQIHPFVTLG